jgi:predicted enzyme related to lactoylglutathione lyase
MHTHKRIYFCRVGGHMAMEAVKARKAHVAIHVKDVSASIEFYGKLFGLSPARCAPDTRNLMWQIRHSTLL